MSAATSLSGATEPSSRAGVTMMSCSTPGGARRERGHQQRRRVDHRVAGRVEADSLDRADDLAEAVVFEGAGGVLHLEGVVVADTGGGDVERIDKRGLDGSVGGLHFVAGDFERAVECDAVDLLVVAADGGVAFLADVAEDAVDDGGGIELGAEDAAGGLADGRREVRFVFRGAAKQGTAGFVGAADYSHER